MTNPSNLISQTKKVTAPASLKQGSIFDIDTVSFKGTAEDYTKFKKKSFSFKDFYPYCDLEVNPKGIVINQSCDLANEAGRKLKIPYINICLVEPLSSILHDSLKNHKEWNKLIHIEDVDDIPMKLVSDDFLNKFPKLNAEFEKIIQNNHSWAFFIILEDEQGLKDVRGIIQIP